MTLPQSASPRRRATPAAPVVRGRCRTCKPCQNRRAVRTFPVGRIASSDGHGTPCRPEFPAAVLAESPLMLAVFVPTANALRKVENLDVNALPADAVWVDLVRPTPGEDKLIEKLT